MNMGLLYTSIYASDTPALLGELAAAPELRRLADVGMHCGCEYTALPLYKQARGPYSRLTHSVGVAAIVWRFTGDIRQAVAGLLHDIATPVFAHTIDFMNGDHMAQESTEDRTQSIIEGSQTIMALLRRHGIRVEDVADYHRYPVADNDTPMLSADRLEYTFGNGYLVNRYELDQIRELYAGLEVAENGCGVPELCVRSVSAAKSFTEMSLKNSRFFVSDGDRFSMQYLAELVRRAVQLGVLRPEDLYATETEVIGKLRGHEELSAMWKAYTEIAAVSASETKPLDRYSVRVSAKKRYINPLVLAGGGVKRISELDAGVKAEMDAFLRLDFDRWLYAR